MTRTQFKALIVQTLFQPREVAGVLIGMRLPRQWLWMALVLMSVLNAIVYSVSLQITTPGDPTAPALMPPAFHSPLLFAMFLFAALAITVLALSWIGQGLGGRAEMDDILVLISWLQVLRLMLQVAVAVLVLVAPVLGAVVIFVASLWGIYILVGFVDAAHRFDNMFKAGGVILLSLIAMAVGLTVVLSVLGVAVTGGT